MTNVVTKKILVEGTSKLVVHLLLEGDGEGELVNYPVLDPTVDFNPNLPAYTQVSIAQIWCSMVWFDIVLGFNALNPKKLWTIARDAAHYHDFRYFGGLKDQAGTDHDGKLLLSTSGFDTPGSVGSIVLELKKNKYNVQTPVEQQSP